MATRTGDAAAAGRRRQFYRSPSLVDYGSVAKLTQGSLDVGADGASAMGKNAQCL